MQAGQPATFGRRKEPHTVIIARGDEIRHYDQTMGGGRWGSPRQSLSAISATSILVLRDDLIRRPSRGAGPNSTGL